MDAFSHIIDCLVHGQRKKLVAAVLEAIGNGFSPQQIINEGLLRGMDQIGKLYSDYKVYVPDLLIAARAMCSAIDVLKPKILSKEIPTIGTAVIGTVAGDIHDIGKSLVKLMLEARGVRVVDLGVDVTAETFIQAALEHHGKVICCSAGLTTTMPMMEAVVQAAIDAEIRESVKIVIGGAPVTEAYCAAIGADYYGNTAEDTANYVSTILKRRMNNCHSKDSRPPK